MRLAVRIVISVLVVLVAAPLASATARKSAPGVSKVKWRLVLRSGLEDAAFVAANDRYVAFLPGSSFPGRLTLIDEQTGRRKQISRPDCPSAKPQMFGGPWLMVSCPTPLYNLSTGRWAPFQISPQCFGDYANCEVVAVGRYWVKIRQDNGYPGGHVFYAYYLQNIVTSQFEPDPATPGGSIFDDLDAPSGSAPLCPPLRYPSANDREGPILGQLTFHGQFAVMSDGAAWRLHRCASNLDLDIGDPTGTYTPLASSRVVVITRDGVTFHGWSLPSLRRFTIRLPIALRADADLLAVTDRKVYVRDVDINNLTRSQLWAATLPSRRPRSRH